ncbi:ankyrin repeat-containing domain protein [Cercophora newfieldiana]|uniref:protein S-acyltransferase n=1 Tax=Cercophora newfieldiana TaxID=92897 RepID=A0AA39Y1G2_9PEZI|nr:ankyrin repeat-containing domain protein [Cercophora newfieldiana]
MPGEPTIGDIILVLNLVAQAVTNYRNAPADIERQKKNAAKCIDELQRHESDDPELRGQVSNALETLRLIQTELDKLQSNTSGPWQKTKRLVALARHKHSNLNHLWGQLEGIKQDMILGYSRRQEIAERDKRTIKHLESISPYSQVIRNDALPGTYEWVFDLNEMEDWAMGSQRVLLFHGHPGTGKSTLLSFIADTIQERNKSDSKVGVAYIRPGDGSPNLKSTEDVLRAILRQLLEKESSKLPQNSESLKKDPKSWSQSQIQNCIQQCASRMSKIFLFIDAVDELEAIMDPGLLKDLIECQKQCEAYMILTSTSIDSLLQGYPKFEFRAHDDDISEYIQSEAPKLRQGLLQDSNHCLPPEVSKEMVDISNGLFLVIKLIMGEAKQQLSIAQLKNTLSEIRNITSGGKSDVLPNLYDYITNKFKGQKCEQAWDVIFWVLFSTRRLLSTELCSLFELSVGHNSGPSRCGSIPIEDVIYPCRGLMTMSPGSVGNRTGQLVHFSHRTVRDYMEKKINDAPKRHAAMVNSLIQVLTSFQYENAVYDYAVNNWYHHYLAAEPSRPLEHHIETLLRHDFCLDPQKDVVQLPSADSFGFSEVLHPARPVADHGPEAFPGIHVAAQFGLHQFLPSLSATKADINSKDLRGVTPLMRAVGNNHSEAVEWLLNKGADPAVYDCQLKSAIHYAVMGRCEASLGLLLRHGGAVMNTDVNNMTPIHHAVRVFHEGLHMLLGAGFSVDTPVTRCRYQLVRQHGSLIYEPVPDGSAVVNPQPKGQPVGLTPLHYAALLGHRSMVDRLLQSGADSSIASHQGETALHIAVACDLQAYSNTLYGHTDAWDDPSQRIESGLEQIASNMEPDDEEAQRFYDEELAYLTESRTAIVKSILDHKKTNPNSQEDLHGFSPLHLKCSPEWTALLLNAGAIPSSRDHHSRTPLHLACLDKTPERVKLLLNHGASVFDSDDQGRNAIHYAAYGGCLNTIKLILNAAQDGNGTIARSEDVRGRGPLHYLIKNSEFRGSDLSDALSVLLSNGADINGMDNEGATPLTIQFQHGCFFWINDKLFDDMLSGGASVTHTSANGKGLGHFYASSCHKMKKSVLERLASLGLDLKATDDCGRTILHDCSIGGSLTSDTLRYLVTEAGLDVRLRDQSGKSVLDCASESAKEAHDQDTFDCCRWRRTERLLDWWSKGEDVSGLDDDKALGECPSDLHIYEDLPYGRKEIGIVWN